MRICFVCNEYPSGVHGGIGTFTQILARALTQAGHEVRVVGTYANADGAPRVENDRDVQVVRLSASTGRFAWIQSRYQLYRTVASWSRRGEIDLVEVPDWQGAAAGWPRLPVPVITRVHGSAYLYATECHRPIDRVLFLLERASLRRSDFCCAVSQDAAGKTKRIFALNRLSCPILYNPVESEFEPPFEARAKNRVVFAGSLVARKGIVPLISSWHRIANALDDAELHIFGKDGKTDNGESMQTYLRRELSNQAAGRVRFHGHVNREKLLSVFRQSRVAVFPSYAETFGLTAVEAMSCGCPTIYTRRGPGPEIIRDGLDGLLVDPDRPNEIADAVVRVLQDEHLAYRLGRSGWQRVQRIFSLREALHQNLSFYRDCISDGQRTTSRSSQQPSVCQLPETAI